MLAIPFRKRSRAGAAGAEAALVRVEPAASDSASVLGRRSKYIDAHAEIAGALLAQRSGEPHALLGWLRGNNTLALPARGGSVEGRAHLLVSDRHAAIVGWARSGERLYTELEPGALTLLADPAQLTLRAGNALFVVSGARRERAGELAALLSLAPRDRVLEGARLNRLAGERAAGAHSNALLELARRQGSARASWLGLLSGHDRPSGQLDPTELGRALELGRVTPEALAELWASWRFSSERASALVEALLALGERAAPWALALHDRARSPESVALEPARAELALAKTRAELALARDRDDARAAALLRVALPGGLAPAAEAPPEAPRAALSDALIRERLTHPASRGARFELGRAAPALLARGSGDPSSEELSDYCEPLLPGAHAAATRAVAAACRALGLPPLPSYVSRGKKSLGVRSQRGSPASLLVGVDHLSEGSAYAMSERELWFAIGAECAHLLLGHGRVTRRDLWTGALSHTRDGLELALGLLPVLRGARLGVRLSSALERVPEPALRRALAFLAGVDLGRGPSPSGPRARALSHFNEELLAAHRVTQLSADRAGLLLAGDLRASLRALLLVRPDYRALLAELEDAALPDNLLPRPASPMLTDLIVRGAALLTFYVSDDYLALRDALTRSAIVDAGVG